MFSISCRSAPPVPAWRPLSGIAHLPPRGNQDSFSCVGGFKTLTHSCPISISGSPGRSGGSVERWNRDMEGHGCPWSNGKKGWTVE